MTKGHRSFTFKWVVFLTCFFLSCDAFSQLKKQTKTELIKGRFIISLKKGVRKSSRLQTKLNPTVSLQDKIKKRFGKVSQKIKARISSQASELQSIEVGELQTRPEVDTLSLLNDLKSDPDFIVEPDYRVQAMETVVPNDPYFPPASGAWGQSFSDQWPLEKLDILKAWEISKGVGVTVAVIDTGVDYNHPELQGQVIKGYDFVDKDSDPMDEDGHGTHVAGTIAAKTNNGFGIAGVAPQAKILAVRVLGAGGGGSLADVAEAIRYSVQQGARVINLSLGGKLQPPQYLKDALDFAHEQDVLVVVAAGNSSIDVREFSPASDSVSLAVGATNSQDEKAGFSNLGDRIGLFAPGGGDALPNAASILSLKSKKSDFDSEPEVVGGQFLRLAGTSMAAPHVAGVAALLRSKYPQYSSNQIRQMLTLGVDELKQTGFANILGLGRLNALKALSVGRPLEVFLRNRTFEIKNQTTLEIEGKVSGDSVQSWELKVGSSMVSERETVLEGKAAVEGVLGNWDLTRFADGKYVMELVATDKEGKKFIHRSDVVIQQNELLSPQLHRNKRIAILQAEKGKAEMKAKIASFAVSTQLEVFDENYQLVSSPPVVVNSGVRSGSFEAIWDTSRLTGGSYYINIYVNNPGGSQSTLHQKVVFDPTLKPGWPYKIPIAGEALFGGSARWGLSNKQKFIDFEGSGKSSLFFSYDSLHFVLGGDGKPRPGWPVPTQDSFFRTPPAVGDISGDGVPEHVTCLGIEVVTLNSDGSPFGKHKWTHPYPYHFGGSSRTFLVDLNSDGKKEIICPSNRQIFVFNSEGETLPGWPVQFGWPWNKKLEYLGGTHLGEMRFSNGRTGLFVFEPKSREIETPAQIHVLDEQGLPVPGWPQSLEIEPFSKYGSNYFDLEFLSVDINQDGNSDLIITATDGILIFDSSGKVLSGWPYLAEKDRVFSDAVSVGDIDGDGWEEVVLTTNSVQRGDELVASIIALNRFGKVLPGFPIEVVGPGTRFSGGSVTPALVDLDGDGALDIVGGPVTRNKDEVSTSIWAFNYLGQKLPGFPKFMPDGADNKQTAGVTDLDGDGRLELLVTDQDLYLFAWDLGVSSTSRSSLVMAGANAGNSFYLPLQRQVGNPTDLRAEARNREVGLSWKAPLNNGGSSIRDYVIEYSVDLGKTWVRFNDGVSDSTHVIVGPLKSGTAYVFRVAAVNTSGQGAFSRVSAISTPHERPNPPSEIIGRIGDKQVSLNWRAPLNRGSAAVTDYVIQVSSDGGKNWVRFNDGVSRNLQASVTQLKNGVAYLFRVAGVNASGIGNFSSQSVSLTPSALPGAPRTVIGTTGDGKISLTWVAPASNGGTPISDYVIQYKLNSSTQWINLADEISPQRRAIISSLKAGSTYQFRVAAINAAGQGAFSTGGSLRVTTSSQK